MKLKDLEEGDIAGFFQLRTTKLCHGVLDGEILASLIIDLIDLKNYMLKNKDKYELDHIDTVEDTLRCFRILADRLKFDQ